MRSRFLAFAAAVCLAAPLAGCAGNTQNVRAYRAYAYETPSLLVALDRTDDIAKSLEVMDKLLLDTPYTPGDEWIGKLPLTSEEAKLLKDDVRGQPPYQDGNYEVPVMKIYRIHLEKVLAGAPTKGKYGSLLEAVGGLGGVELKAHWQAMRDKANAFLKADAAFEKEYAAAFPPGTKRTGQEPASVTAARQAKSDAKDELNKAQETLEKDVEAIAKGNPEGDQLKELTTAVSVAYRLELESLAMIPIVAIQAVRALPRAGKEAKDAASDGVSLIKGIKQISELPDYISGIKEKMSREGEVLELMTKALAKASKSKVEETAGFQLKESVVDQVMGVTADSFKVTVKAGAEAFFYNNVKNATDPNANQSDSGSSNKVVKDYTGHLRELRYEVKPIMLAAFNANVGFDYIQLPNAGNFNFGYKTDRVFSSGGSVESGSLSQQLGVKGVASDALDFGLGILGVKTAVRVATFTAGTVHYVDATTGNDVVLGGKPATGIFQINYTQIDVGYDLSFLLGESAGKYFLEELTVGGRYFQYALPRILYELEYNGPPNADTKTYKWVSESAPQNVTSKYYMGGVTGRFGAGPSAMIAPFADLGIYAGAGPAAYYLRTKAPNAQNVDSPQTTNLADPSQNQLQNKSAFAANVVLALGARLHITHGSRLRISGEAQYRAELIYSQTKADSGSDPNKDRIVDSGGADLFHGPRLSVVGEF
jgi:hypothetical protein